MRLHRLEVQDFRGLRQADVTFGSGGSGSTITVNPNSTFQSMVGFGASFTDAAAWNVFNSPRRNEIMTNLFDKNNGIGLSFVRQPIGATCSAPGGRGE